MSGCPIFDVKLVSGVRCCQPYASIVKFPVSFHLDTELLARSIISLEVCACMCL